VHHAHRSEDFFFKGVTSVEAEHHLDGISDLTPSSKMRDKSQDIEDYEKGSYQPS